jgi:hypothetical protein
MHCLAIGYMAWRLFAGELQSTLHAVRIEARVGKHLLASNTAEQNW